MIANIQEVLIEQRKKKRIHTDRYKEGIECERILLGPSFLDEHSSLFFSFFLSLYQFFPKCLHSMLCMKNEKMKKRKMRKIYDY